MRVAAAPPAAGADAARERRLVDAALRASAMRGPLLAAFGGPEATPCHVLDAKYEPRSSCTVLYQLGNRLVTAVLSSSEGDGDSGGVPVAPGVRAFLFPDDPRLPGLRAATDPEVLAEALGGDRRTRTRVTLLRYRPGKRATIGIELRARTTSLTLVGKVYRDGRKAAAVYDETRGLARALEGERAVAVAPAQELLPEFPMVLWRPVPGSELEPRLTAAKGPELLRGVAAALLAVHGAPLVSSRRRPVGAELERFHQRATGVAEVAPELGRTLLEWTAALVDRGDRLDHPRPGLVHGDCKPSQFRVARSFLSLLDFDHCGLADPASDTGTFLASLRQRSRRPLEEPFLHAYAGAVSDAAFPTRALWYESVALLRKALRAFARSPRSPVPGLLAAEGRECLGRVTP